MSSWFSSLPKISVWSTAAATTTPPAAPLDPHEEALQELRKASAVIEREMIEYQVRAEKDRELARTLVARFKARGNPAYKTAAQNSLNNAAQNDTNAAELGRRLQQAKARIATHQKQAANNAFAKALEKSNAVMPELDRDRVGKIVRESSQFDTATEQLSSDFDCLSAGPQIDNGQTSAELQALLDMDDIAETAPVAAVTTPVVAAAAAAAAAQPTRVPANTPARAKPARVRVGVLTFPDVPATPLPSFNDSVGGDIPPDAIVMAAMRELSSQK